LCLSKTPQAWRITAPAPNPPYPIEIDEQAKKILEDPEIGESKKGDLRGIRIHKFNFKNQLYLISYDRPAVSEPGERLDAQRKNIAEKIQNKNGMYFDSEMDKLDRWADDRRNSLKTALVELNESSREIDRQKDSLLDEISARLEHKIGFKRRKRK